MQRPNLAGKPFKNTRPVWLASAVMAAIALIFSAVNLSEALGARESERAQAQRLESLTRRRIQLVKNLDTANRELAKVPWKKLQAETTSLQGVVARRALSWGRLLLNLERVLPWDIRLSSIDPSVTETGGIQITLRGVAATREGWLHLVALLFTDEKFSDPVPISEESPGSSGMQGYAFQVKVMYWPGGRP
jgi:hypothetical protein